MDESGFLITTRNSGTLWAGGENYGNIDLLRESELSAQKQVFRIEKTEDPELFWVVENETKMLCCTREHRYPFVDFGEEEGY